jgi:pimeloyl-ACP methyl ester carboxylesterase
MPFTDYVFVHGGGQGSWVWRETIAALRLQAGEGAIRAFALDAPGCGTKRGRATEALTIHDVAEELVADLEAAGAADIVLVGHSQAGQVLPLMARLRPGLFRRLVYVSCSAPLPGQTVHAMMGSGAHGADPEKVGWPFDPATAGFAEGFPLMFCNDMDEAEAAAFMAKLGKDAWPPKTYAAADWAYDDLPIVPATFVHCLKDMSLPPDWQQVFAERLKAGRHVRIDAGHQVMNTRPHALAEVLRGEAALQPPA